MDDILPVFLAHSAQWQRCAEHKPDTANRFITAVKATSTSRSSSYDSVCYVVFTKYFGINAGRKGNKKAATKGRGQGEAQTWGNSSWSAAISASCRARKAWCCGLVEILKS